MALAKINFLEIVCDICFPSGYKMVCNPLGCSFIKSRSAMLDSVLKISSSVMSEFPNVRFSFIVPSKGFSSANDNPSCALK